MVLPFGIIVVLDDALISDLTGMLKSGSGGLLDLPLASCQLFVPISVTIVAS